MRTLSEQWMKTTTSYRGLHHRVCALGVPMNPSNPRTRGNEKIAEGYLLCDLRFEILSPNLRTEEKILFNKRKLGLILKGKRCEIGSEKSPQILNSNSNSIQGRRNIPNWFLIRMDWNEMKGLNRSIVLECMFGAISQVTATRMKNVAALRLE